MTTEETTSRGTVYNQVAVAYLQHIRSSTATRTLCPTMPRPAIFGDESSPTRSEGVVFAFARGDGRGVVDIRIPYLRIGREDIQAERYQK
jgi:hypothetical protein